MELTHNWNSDNSWKNNRDLLRMQEQERRRRQVAPEDPFSGKTHLFAKPYKTNKEDALSRRVKSLLGDYWNPEVPVSHESPLNPMWIPQKPKSSSHDHRPASSWTNPFADIWREYTPESPYPKKNYGNSNEGLSNWRSEAKASQFEIVPELVKKKQPIDVLSMEQTLKVVEKPTSSLGPPRVFQSQHKRVAPAQRSSSESGSTRDCHGSSASALPRAPAPEPIVHTYMRSPGGILKEMTSPLSPLLPFLQSPVRTETYTFPLQAEPSDVPLTEEIFKEMISSPPALLSYILTPTRTETYELPLAAKESHPDGSAAQKQKQASTASETLPSSQPGTSVFQSQHKRVAPAQRSSSESGSTRDCHSSSVCDREISTSDSEEDSLPRVLDLPVCEPGPSSAKKRRLDSLVTQTKQGAVPREGPREIAHGNGHEEGVKQEQGTSSSSCQQHSEAREPPHKSCGQVATDFHKTFGQVAKDTHEISGQMTKHFQETSVRVTKAPWESHVMSTHSSLKPLEHTKEALWVSKIVGIKRPSDPLVHDKSRKVLKLESEPGPSGVKNHSSKDKLEVQEAENTQPAFGKGLRPGGLKHLEKKKHREPEESWAHVPKAPDQSCSPVAKAPHESDITSKHSFLKPPVHTKEALLKNTLGIQRPSMFLVHRESKRVWKAESEPGPSGVKNHSSKDKLEVQEAENTQPAFGKGLRPGGLKHLEKKKHREPEESWAHVPKAPDQSCSPVAKAPHESDVMSKHSFLKPPVHTEEALLKNTLGIQRPSMFLVHRESKRVWKAESEPGPSGVKNHSSKDKLEVQEAENTQPAFGKGLRPGGLKHLEKKKHREPEESWAHVPKAPDQSCSPVAKAPHESDVTSKHSFLKPPVHTKEALLKNTLGIQRPSMFLVHHESKRVWKAESEPGPSGVKNHSSKDKLEVQEAENTQPAFGKGLRPGGLKHLEKKKHREPEESWAHVPKAPDQSCSPVAKAPHESDVTSKHSFLKPPVHTKEALLKNTLGIQRPSMFLVHRESKRVWKAESEPGPSGVRDHSSKDKLEVQEAENTQPAFGKGLRPGGLKHLEKKKHREPEESWAHVPKAPDQSCSPVAKAPHESDVTSKHSFLKPPVHTEEALLKNTLGIQRPSMFLVHRESKRVWKAESEPGPSGVRDHSSKDKLEVQEAENTQPAFGNGLRPGGLKHLEKKKHREPEESWAHVPKAPDQSCSPVAKAPHESDVTSKHSFLKPPVHTEEALLKNTLGIQRPSMFLVHRESKRVWKAESEPGPSGVRDHSSKDKLEVQEAENTQPAFGKGLRPGGLKHLEKKKHREPEESWAHVPKAPDQSCSPVAKAPHESDVTSKHSFLKPPVHTEEALLKNTLGIQRPSMFLVHRESKRVWKAESEPGPSGVRDHSSKDKLEVQEAENTQPAFGKGLRPGGLKHLEKKKHREPEESWAHVPKAPDQSCSPVAKAPHESDVMSKHSFLKPPVHTEEALLKNTLGIQRPSMFLVHRESKRVWKAESEPGPSGVKNHSSKDKLEVQEAENTQPAFGKGLRPGGLKHLEKKKHREPEESWAHVPKAPDQSCSPVAKAPHESDITSKHSFLKPPVHTKEALLKNTLGIQRPSMFLVHRESKRVWKAESEPGPSGVKNHSSKDKLEVQEAENTQPAFGNGLRPGGLKHLEKKKHREPEESWAHVPKAPDQSCSPVAKAPHESDVTSKHSFLKPPVHTKEALLKNTLGIQRPSMFLVHHESKRVWKAEREPGPLQVAHQSCKDQPDVKKTMKPTLQKPSEERKDKGSHQDNAEDFLEPRLLRPAQECDALIPSDHRPEHSHKEKVPLPPGNKKLFSPAREADLKRKAMRSPEESPGKKREDKGDTPRKKKE